MDRRARDRRCNCPLRGGIAPAFLAALAFLPPGAGAGVRAEKLLDRDDVDWLTSTSEHFRVHHPRGSRAEREIDAVIEAAERGFARSTELLGEPATNLETIDLFVVDDRETLTRLTGRVSTGTAFPEQRVVVQLTGVRAAHEIFHVVVHDVWGRGPRWLNEGLAVYADDRWHGRELHESARRLDADGGLHPAEDLVRRFHRLPDASSYPAAGSLVKFVCERFGRETARAAWLGGRKALAEATGLDLDALDRAWRRALRDRGGASAAPSEDR